MYRMIGRLGMLCLLAAASPCAGAAGAEDDNLNLQCYDSTAPGGQKLYTVFWLDLKVGIVTIGSAAAKAGDPDNPSLQAVSRTVPLTVTPEAFTFDSAGGREIISRKTGVYTSGGGKQERCWKGAMPVPASH
jgi:hypothetical protein